MGCQREFTLSTGSDIFDTPARGIEPLPCVSTASLFVASNAVSTELNSEIAPGPIASFQIRYLLGEGGMGVVYCAEQENPKRLVALKVLKAQRAGPDALRRFKREAEVLGRLQHRGIAQIYAAGEANNGGSKMPFMAMELIDGLPMTAYAAKEKLSSRQRLELLLKVCAAIQYAHEHGVIHRDLKPSNILVDSQGEPKVLDFGLSLALQVEDRLESVLTQPGQLLGTLAYMSPEQVTSAGKVDVRADIYSLGIIAYELLTGRRPYTPPIDKPLEAMHMICMSEISPLSSIDQQFRGDIDTIVGKALDKVSARRYATVEEFSNDIRCYLTDNPIQARRPSMAYRSRKFVRRHRSLVGTVAGIILTLTVGIIATARQAIIAKANARDAEMRLTDSMMAQADALLLSARVPEARAIYNTAWNRLESFGEPTLPAELGVWEADVRQKRAIREWQSESTGMVGAVVFLPDGLGAISGGNDGMVRVWDLVTGAERFRIDHKGTIVGVAVSHDGVIAASTAVGGKLKVWETATGAELLSTQLPGAVPLVFSADDKYLVAGTHIWPVGSKGEPYRFIDGEGFHAGAISREGVLATGGMKEVKLWKIPSGEFLRSYPREENQAYCLAFSPDGQQLISRESQQLVVTRVSDGVRLSAIQKRVGRHFEFVGPHQIASVFAGQISIFDPALETVQLSIAAKGVQQFAVSSDQKILLQGDEGGKLSLWYLGASLERQDFVGHTRDVRFAVVGRSGELAFSVARDNTARVWDVASGIELYRFECDTGLNCIAMSPDGRLVFGGMGIGPMVVWDLETLEHRQFAYDDKASIQQIVVLKDWHTMVVGRSPAELDVWDLRQNKVIQTIKLSEATLTGLVELPNGAILATDIEGRVYRLDSLKAPVRTLQAVQGGPTIVAAQGRESFAYEENLRPGIRIGNSETGKARAVLLGHSAQVVGISPLANDRMLASVAKDASLRVWDMQRGVEVRRLDDVPSSSLCMDGTEDHRILVTGGGEGSVRAWKFGRPELERKISAEANLAFGKAQHGAVDGDALLVIARWWEFCGADRLAAEGFRRSRSLGGKVPSLALARCHARLNEFAAAYAELRTALAGRTDLTLTEKLWLKFLEEKTREGAAVLPK